MNGRMTRWGIRILAGLAIVVMGSAGVFLVYASDYSRANADAMSILNSSGVEDTGDFVVLTPSTPGSTALIFYPGGKVEHFAYLPLLAKLRDAGITCVLVRMPLRLAVFDVNAADAVMEALPQIDHWYMGGHSLGGAMAGSYAGEHQDQVKGLILLGAYRYGEFDAADALTVYGSEDRILDRTKITDTENVLLIDGGNHAQFGDYGPQKGDGIATISTEEQQLIAVEAIVAFIDARE
jgi:pimeloyl-ACP methyl ester carboxylesterase